MGTRATYTFRDRGGDEHHVYIHYDGHPTGAAEKIYGALMGDLTWELPRFEADEAAAGFVAANKDKPGGVRLLPSGKWQAIGPPDIEYHYDIEQEQGDTIYVTAYSADLWDRKNPKWEVLFTSPLTTMMRMAEQWMEDNL